MRRDKLTMLSSITFGYLGYKKTITPITDHKARVILPCMFYFAYRVLRKIKQTINAFSGHVRQLREFLRYYCQIVRIRSVRFHNACQPNR